MTIKVTYNVTDVYMSQSVSPVYINVSYSDGGTSGGGVWGSITGTLSNQTDLQNALNAKLDESTIDGGTEGQILSKASATDFDFTWINNYAKYLATNVRNQSGSTIGAFQVVYISGATGNKPLVSLADADTEATSSKTYGVTATAIANNGTGDVVTAGELSGIDTSAFNEGDLLWLSTTAGGVVTSPPAEPAHAVFIGYVVRSHPTLGTIDVSIQNGYELNELHGVQITTPTDNQGLFYNATSTLWENKSITTALGYTPVPTTRNITINGVTYDLSADRTYTIAAGISGSGAAGQVTYWTGASAVSGSNNFTWDGNNINLASDKNIILQRTGTNRNISITSGNFIDNFAGAFIYPSSGTNVGASMSISPRGTGYSAGIKSQISIFNTDFIADGTNYEFSVFRAAGTAFTLTTGKAGTGTIRPFLLSSGFADGSTNPNHLWLYANGNVGINTSSDLGVRFGVVGDTLLRGSGNTSTTTALTIQDISSNNLFSFRNNGTLTIPVVASQTSPVISIFQRSGIINNGSYVPILKYGNTVDDQNQHAIMYGFWSSSNVSGFRFRHPDGSGGGGVTFSFIPLVNQIASNVVNIQQDFTPTSGGQTITQLLINPTINQTGGANGITRGLYVNPNLTSAADWRSIEWSNSSGWGLYGAGTANNYLGGNISIGTLSTTDWLNIAASTTAKAHIFLAAGVAPTSPANGDIWFDGTDIKMRIGGVTKTFTLV